MNERAKSEIFQFLPNGWEATTLLNIIGANGLFVDGDWIETDDQDANGDVRLIQLADIGDGYFRNKSNRFLTETRANEIGCTYLNIGDILIARMPDPLGRACVFPGDKKKSVTAVDVAIVRIGDNGISNRWLMYTVNSPQFRIQVESYQSGSTRKRISRSNLSKIVFGLPPIPEQHRIVAKIEELFTQLDASEAALKRAKANLGRYRRSVLQAASSGQLVEQDSTDEPASKTIRRTWDDRRQSQPKLPFQTDDLPQLSDGWCWASLEQLTDGSRYAMKAGPFGSALKKEFYVPTGFKIYGQEQVIRGDPYYGDYYISRDLFEKLQSCEVKPGDVLVSLVGTIGKVLILPINIEPGIINPRLVKFSFDYRIVDSRYFKYYLESQTARDYFSIASHGQTMDVLNLGILRSLPIPLPPLNEQKRIIMEVERSESLAENQNKVVDKSLSRISRMRQSILGEAFTGQLVDQNPEDEPASVLLQRIQAEREGREKQQAVKPKKEIRKVTEEQKRKPLVETLHAAGARLTPEELFRRAGFDEECVDEFYEELRQELQIEVDGLVVKPGRIKEERPNQAYIYLSEVKS